MELFAIESVHSFEARQTLTAEIDDGRSAEVSRIPAPIER
jgi:hypothetical protein